LALVPLDSRFRAFDELAKIAGMLGKSNGRADLHEPLDRLPNLIVENAPVGTITESKTSLALRFTPMS
jgi:hypothetical protein